MGFSFWVGEQLGFAPRARPELPKKATLSSAAPAHDTMDGPPVAKVAASSHSAALILRSGCTPIGLRDSAFLRRLLCTHHLQQGFQPFRHLPQRALAGTPSRGRTDSSTPRHSASRLANSEHSVLQSGPIGRNRRQTADRCQQERYAQHGETGQKRSTPSNAATCATTNSVSRHHSGNARKIQFSIYTHSK
jgi:hypothetical protein